MRLLWIPAVLAATALSACNSHPVESLDKVVTAVNRQENRLPAKTKIDFVFMVDNSGSMCEEQRNLTANFRAFSDFLFEELGSSADYRIAVISTDMHAPNNQMGRFLREPAPPVPSLNCRDEDGNAIAPDTNACQGLIDSGNLPTIIKSGREGNIGRECAGSPNPEQCAKDDLELKFRCLATLGTNGDGFEKGLEAMRLSLSCSGPNSAQFGACCVDTNNDGKVDTYDPGCTIPLNDPGPEFLRPDAVLVMIFVTDEDDCSDPATNPAASRLAICKYGVTDADGDGVPDGYRDPELCEGNPAGCFQRECGDEDPAECRVRRCVISRSENSNCEWQRDTLVPVQNYRDFLIGLKPRPLEQILVASVVGERAYTDPGAFEITYNRGRPAQDQCDPESGSYDPSLEYSDTCCPEGRCKGSIQPSCESANGQAFAGRRYLQLTEMLDGIGCPAGTEGDEECVSICVDDFAQPLEAIKERVAGIVASYCLDKPPACTVATEEGPRRCENQAERDNTANYQIDVQVQCTVAIEEGGNCAQEDLGIRQLSRANGEWELFLNEGGCPGGALVRLTDPPPAGADVLVEFQVEVGVDDSGGGGGQRDGGGGGGNVNLDSGVVNQPQPDAAGM